MGNDEQKMSQLKKLKLLTDLNDLNRELMSYKRRQEKHVRMKFTEGQMRKLDELLTRTRDKFRGLKDTISKYGGSASIKIAGVKYNAFEYSLNPRSLYVVPELFTALDMAINTVNTAIREIEAIPIDSLDWRDITVTEHIENSAQFPLHLFESMRLHPDIVAASRSLFESGHYAQAIFEAFKAVEDFVRRKTGLSSYGKQLMAHAFNEDNPLITVTEAGMVNKDVQEGFKFLFMGAMVGIRNPKAHHKIVQRDPFITLEYLGFASFLLKRIEGWQANR